MDRIAGMRTAVTLLDMAGKRCRWVSSSYHKKLLGFHHALPCSSYDGYYDPGCYENTAPAEKEDMH